MSAKVGVGSKQQPEFFARQATGLVREAGFLDMVLFNAVENTTLGVGFAFGVTYILTALVGTNLVVSQIIATVFGLFVVTTWGLLSAAMPRSGGDYILNTRALSPVLGFMGSWGMLIGNLVFAATVGAWMSQLMLAPAFASLGMVTHNSTLASIGNALGTPGWTFVVGTITLALTGIIVTLGMRVAMRVQAIMVVIGMLGFLVALVVLIFLNHAAFISNFNAVARPYTHVADSYHYFLTSAAKGGLSITYSHSFEYTVIAFLAIQGFVANSFWSAYVAGEVKGARQARRTVGMMITPVIVTGTLLTIAFVLLFDRAGYNFVTAANYLSSALPAKYAIPAPPYSSLLVAITTNNGLVTFIVGFGLCGWGIAMAIANYLFLSRILFAWAFDRIVPLRIAAVNDRLHSPVVALAIVFVGADIFLAVYSFLHNQITSFVASYFLIPQLALVLVGISGMLFPYLRPELYRTSPARIEVLGIPVITIAGAVTALGELVTPIIYFFYPTLGLPDAKTALAILLIPLALGLGVFLVATYVRRSEGLDLGAVYREIPPE